MEAGAFAFAAYISTLSAGRFPLSPSLASFASFHKTLRNLARASPDNDLGLQQQRRRQGFYFILFYFLGVVRQTKATRSGVAVQR